MAALEVLPEPQQSLCQTTLSMCAYAGTGDVLVVQQMLHICSKHYETDVRLNRSFCRWNIEFQTEDWLCIILSLSLTHLTVRFQVFLNCPDVATYSKAKYLDNLGTLREIVSSMKVLLGVSYNYVLNSISKDEFVSFTPLLVINFRVVDSYKLCCQYVP